MLKIMYDQYKTITLSGLAEQLHYTVSPLLFQIFEECVRVHFFSHDSKNSFSKCRVSSPEFRYDGQ